MRPLILRLFSAAKLLLMFELNKFLFLFLNDLLRFTGLWREKRMVNCANGGFPLTIL